MPTQDEMLAVAAAYVDAYKRNDRDSVVALFAPDATFEDPVGKPPHIGRAAIAAFWDEIHTLAAIELVQRDVIVCGNEMVMILEVHATAGDSTMILDAVDVFVIDDGGKISSLKAFWDMSRARTRGA
jgi:steroid delta-isomerase